MKRPTAPLSRLRGTGAKRRRSRRKPHKAEQRCNAANVGRTDDGRMPNWIRIQSERAKAKRKVAA